MSGLKVVVVALGGIGLLVVLALGLAQPVRAEGGNCGSAVLADSGDVDEGRRTAEDARRSADEVRRSEAEYDDSYAQRFSDIARAADRAAGELDEACGDARRDRQIVLLVAGFASVALGAVGLVILD